MKKVITEEFAVHAVRARELSQERFFRNARVATEERSVEAVDIKRRAITSIDDHEGTIQGKAAGADVVRRREDGWRGRRPGRPQRRRTDVAPPRDDLSRDSGSLPEPERRRQLDVRTYD